MLLLHLSVTEASQLFSGCVGMDCSWVKCKKLESAICHLSNFDKNFLKAVTNNDYTTVKTLVEAGADVNCSSAGWTPLCISCYYGFTKIVQYLLMQPLLELRPQVMLCLQCGRHCYQCDYDEDGNTPLVYAAKHGHYEVCRLLLDAGVCLEQPNKRTQQTPLFVAAESAQTDVCLLLLEASACVQVRDNIGMTPLYAAIKSKDKTVVENLIKHGCDVNIGSQDHPPIFLAARLGLFDIVKILSDAGCQKDVSNKYGVTPVYEAAIKDFRDILEHLLDKGWDSNKCDMYQNTPLHIMASKNCLQSTQLLLKAGASIQVRDYKKRSPVQVSLLSGSAHVLEYYLKIGVNLHKGFHSMERMWTVVVREMFEKDFIDCILVLLKDDCCWPLVEMIEPWERSLLHNFNIIRVFSQKTKLLKTLIFSGNYAEPLESKDNQDVSLTTDSVKQSAASVIINCFTPFILEADIRNWLANIYSSPMTLQALTRIVIRQELHSQILYKSQFLPLPKILKDYITLSKL
ncbi:ankyrin repeat domain-containing protein 50 isoform X1 [Octopus bimaculoides]|uniref:ankyrin repeat domain-containing protein 50 isoform X1 n=1 Tax=Octopus bimaculoides TaxID=37653 RepID=UPI0022E0E05A|nr:ankyrin repeat domain-containing protein 50 isoform X1 [Octopus bimaculoides]